jgi:DNA-binding transcriptional ArsR family regulator/uncharacterized protein YndB with AHSA1/START domain
MPGSGGQPRPTDPEEAASIWWALADPTRRRILDLLKERPRITGDIASQFEISRIAVMRHLDLLSRTGLVVNRKRGRERWHYLNTVPLQRIHRRWFDPAAAGWASALLRLKDRVEIGAADVSSSRPAVDIALEVAIEGTPAAVFAAMTQDTGGWWGHPFLSQQATGLTLDGRLGGLFVERWDDGGAVLAAVTARGDDRHLELTGPFHLGFAVGVAVFELTPSDGGTLLRFSFRAAGAVEPDVAEQFSTGWTELIANRLRSLVERGIRLGIAPDAPSPRIAARNQEEL